jgi:hypothetical protein
VGFADFEPTRLSDAPTRALSSRVRLSPHAESDLSLGEVRVTLTDGRQLSARASVAMGRGPANPMTPAEVQAKFDDCTRALLPAAQGAALLARLSALAEEPSMRALGALMQPPAPLPTQTRAAASAPNER